MGRRRCLRYSCLLGLLRTLTPNRSTASQAVALEVRSSPLLGTTTTTTTTFPSTMTRHLPCAALLLTAARAAALALGPLTISALGSVPFFYHLRLDASQRMRLGLLTERALALRKPRLTLRTSLRLSDVDRRPGSMQASTCGNAGKWGSPPPSPSTTRVRLPTGGTRTLSTTCR